MPLPVAAIALLALPVISGAGKSMKSNDAALIIGGLGALWLLNKITNFPDIPNPLPALQKAAETVIQTADELTGGLQKDETESFQEYFFEYDVPFSDERITWRELAPGLSPDRSEAYTTETTGAVAMDIVEPGQTTGEWLTSIDFPGIDPYNFKDAPGDIWQGVKKLNPF